jgi:transposase-like protein
MVGPRKRYSTELKTNVALEAIKGQKMANEIAAEYGAHPSQITQFKKRVLDGLPNVFSTRSSNEKAKRRSWLPSTNTLAT